MKRLGGHLALPPCLAPVSYSCHCFRGHQYHHHGFLLALQFCAGSCLVHSFYETPPHGPLFVACPIACPFLPSFSCSRSWSFLVDVGGGGTLASFRTRNPTCSGDWEGNAL